MVVNKGLKFNPEVTLGHVISTLVFVGVGVGLYVSIVNDLNTLKVWRDSIESLDLTVEISDVRTREHRVKQLEMAAIQQQRTNEKILEQLQEINLSVAVFAERFAHGDSSRVSP